MYAICRVAIAYANAHIGYDIAIVKHDHAIPDYFDHHAILDDVDHHAFADYVNHHAIPDDVDHHAFPDDVGRALAADERCRSPDAHCWNGYACSDAINGAIHAGWCNYWHCFRAVVLSAYDWRRWLLVVDAPASSAKHAIEAPPQSGSLVASFAANFIYVVASIARPWSVGTYESPCARWCWRRQRLPASRQAIGFVVVGR